MKRLLIFLGVIGLTASLGAQSLVDLAKREKERRESFRGHHAVVVKNRDLLQVKKVPAVEVTIPEGEAGEDVRAGGQGIVAPDIAGEPGLTNPQDEPGAASAPAPNPENLTEDIIEGGGPLEDQLKVVDALVEELTTEMNSLRQQYEAQNTMVPGSVIQQQIDETYQRLVKAQTRQDKLLEKLGKKGVVIKRDAGPVDR
jgi:hypothetical protein